MKKIYTIVGIIIVVGVLASVGLYFSHPTPLATKTFSVASGAYSFAYPAQYSVVEQENAAFIAVNPQTEKQPLVAVTPGYYPHFLAYMQSMKQSQFVQTSIKGVTVYKFTTSGYGAISMYILPVDNVTDPSSFIVVTRNNNATSSLSEQDIENIVTSLKFDADKVAAIGQQQLKTAKTKGNEARLLEETSIIRASAELYYNKYNSYAGMCAPTTKSPESQSLNTIFDALVKNVGADNVVCVATKSAYAASVRIPIRGIQCVDSTGLFATSSVMVTGTSCKK